MDATGNLCVVNHGKQGTIGRLLPGAAQSELFIELPAGSVGNAIRFDRDGRMFIADYKNHNVFVLERGASEPQVYFHSDDFNQPNDLTIAADGTIYASDPSWRRRDGQVWRIARGPTARGAARRWRSTASSAPPTASISAPMDRRSMSTNPRRARSGLIGSRTPSSLPRASSRSSPTSPRRAAHRYRRLIYVTRILKGTVVVLTPDGKLVREIPLQAKEPTNLAFGGPDGKTVSSPSARAASSSRSGSTAPAVNTACKSPTRLAQRRHRPSERDDAAAHAAGDSALGLAPIATANAGRASIAVCQRVSSV